MLPPSSRLCKKIFSPLYIPSFNDSYCYDTNLFLTRCNLFTNLHGVTYQKIKIFVITAVGNSELTKVTWFFFIHVSVHLDSELKRSNKMQQSADIYLLQNHSTCFGCLSRPSSGVQKTVTAASGTGHIT